MGCGGSGSGRGGRAWWVRLKSVGFEDGDDGGCGRWTRESGKQERNGPL